MGYNRLTYKDRKLLESLLKRNTKVTSIAKIIGCTRSTIYRELKRVGSDQTYSADVAQQTL